MNFTAILGITTAILLYGLICFYIGFNGWAWLSRFPRFVRFKYLYFGLIFFLAISMFAGRFIPIPFLSLIGGYWMVIIGYSLLLFPILNLIYFLNKKRGMEWIGGGVLIFYAVIFIYGTFNAWSPVIRNYSVDIDKPYERDSLKLLMASDFHLGEIVDKDHLDRFIAISERVKPDMILIPGDLIDDYIEPYLEENMGESLKKLNAPLGVFAVLGNHDYYGGDKEKIVKEMEKAGITVLEDETITIRDQLTIAGRKDPTDRTRSPISSFLDNADGSRPVIMMDHQPIDLEEAEQSGVDLLVSGHTHRGQVAPAQFITDMIYENDYGFLQKGNMSSIVTSGFGTWGPALRIGTRSEAVLIHLHFN
ncbi:phosphoesterase [Bacillus sp. FJAT-27225]|uniref:metallophosphoesterase n=1 Tax=Bacillus sp. FJAT-27225 TaxID=1743144 RepID=UPI00080C2C48|nr:metallophosphoesterase [Bacillus sp. FJAT-27225]OCA90610.1 phosphoesterase [Bacillus sp. FJAT-27225]